MPDPQAALVLRFPLLQSVMDLGRNMLSSVGALVYLKGGIVFQVYCLLLKEKARFY